MSGCHPENKTKKLNEINMDLCCHGRILMMNDCYYCKADKEKLDILKRIMTLENFVGQNYMRDMDALGERCKRLESYMEMEDRVTAEARWGNPLQEKVSTLEKTINELIDKIADIGNHYYRERQEPFKCPVCNGSGKDWNRLVSMGTYEGVNRLVPDKCNGCKGEGILWK